MPPSSGAGRTLLDISPGPGGVYRLRMDSSDGLNRISMDLLRQLGECPAAHPHARGFVLLGNVRNFSVGADLNAIAALDPATAWTLSRQGQHWLNSIANAAVPFVAAVEGYCLGGGLDLALACRARVCTPAAYFGHHGAKLGLVTGWGGTQRLPRLIGRARALEHLLAAQGWSPDAALAQGLVQRLCPPEDLIATAARLALP